jgi:hypothetical protein
VLAEPDRALQLGAGDCEALGDGDGEADGETEFPIEVEMRREKIRSLQAWPGIRESVRECDRRWWPKKK